jgi:hypothetical protein
MLAAGGALTGCVGANQKAMIAPSGSYTTVVNASDETTMSSLNINLSVK